MIFSSAPCLSMSYMCRGKWLVETLTVLYHARTVPHYNGKFFNFQVTLSRFRSAPYQLMFPCEPVLVAAEYEISDE